MAYDFLAREANATFSECVSDFLWYPPLPEGTYHTVDFGFPTFSSAEYGTLPPTTCVPILTCTQNSSDFSSQERPASFAPPSPIQSRAPQNIPQTVTHPRTKLPSSHSCIKSLPGEVVLQRVWRKLPRTVGVQEAHRDRG